MKRVGVDGRGQESWLFCGNKRVCMKQGLNRVRVRARYEVRLRVGVALKSGLGESLDEHQSKQQTLRVVAFPWHQMNEMVQSLSKQTINHMRNKCHE
jgi:hypothetical protein